MEVQRAPPHIVGYKGAKQYVSSAVCWHSGQPLPQCDLVRQRRHGSGKSWKYPIGQRAMEDRQLMAASIKCVDMWFRIRALDQVWRFEGIETHPERPHHFELVYSFAWDASIEVPTARAVRVFHGTKFYNLHSITMHGLQESNDAAQGHDFHGRPGVFVSAGRMNADDHPYATPQNLFGSGVYYSAYLELVADIGAVTYRGKQDFEWVFPREALRIQRLRITANRVVSTGESRLQGWEPHLEMAAAHDCVVATQLFNEWQ